ncbi:hypothetical protein OIV83_004327 [Microbotryomycetes sp. JL201]|nr:hypothetical protein OIV83_004298 [Microbotryomycetes sp. JL201]KAK4049180.1 hypothetical protein OIV83_004327 [Microbotryomycetes sp. JL201]
MSTVRVGLHELPVSQHAPIYHLPADPLFPEPKSLLDLSSYKLPPDFGAKGPVALNEGDPVPPSMLRRSRAVRNGACFTYVSPLPLTFPYNTKELNDSRPESENDTIEDVLAKLEPSRDHVVATVANGAPTAYEAPLRQRSSWPEPRLLALSHKCLQEWLPQLDPGEEGSRKRKLLIDILGGKTVIVREGEESFAPWSLCYGGHQFGSWANQLGDGRAISIMSTPATDDVRHQTGFPALELQLKGAGRTPYSRFADGLAVLRSSVREFLGSEAMAALGQPTSRSLALVGLPDVKVQRETMETAAIVTRVATSWIRIGNFEIQNTLFCLEKPEESSSSSRSLGLAVLREVSERNAKMIAGWQAYGFMHGVMNTDNISVNGACIDYGPYAFMDVFDPWHICNHSDDLGRYSFRNQPTMGVFAITKLGDALAELIGCELDLEETGAKEGFVHADEGWGRDGIERNVMQDWRKAGLEQVEAVKSGFVETFTQEYTRLMRLRLGLQSAQDGDFELVSGLLDLMALHSLDFTNTLRLLSQFPGSTTDPVYEAFIEHLLPAASVAANPMLPPTARDDWRAWFDKYAARLSQEQSSGQIADRRSRMNAVNPRFTLRQWVLEETIKSLDHQRGDTRMLERVLDMVGNPFESYGELDVGTAVCELLDEEGQERQRLCGIGSQAYLGFQCSCSS